MWALFHELVDRLRIGEGDESKASRLSTLIFHHQRIAHLTEFSDVLFQRVIGRSTRDGSLSLLGIDARDSLERQSTDEEFTMLLGTSTVS